MEHPGTITRIIRDLEGAEHEHPRRDDAVRELWERFFADLTRYARRRMKAIHAPAGPADEEDAAARAFTKVCRGIERGQFRPVNRVDLTRVLRTATAREVFTLLDRARVVGAGTRGDEPLDQVADHTLPPDLMLLAYDACQRLLGLLNSDDLRQVALWKLVGHTNEAIAERLDCSIVTVERMLARIRETWRNQWGDAVPRGSARSGPRRGSTQADGPPDNRPDPLADMTPDDEARLIRDLVGLG